jgi:hypothetical protein
VLGCAILCEIQLRIAESAVVSNGDRYNLVCHSYEGFLSLSEVKQVLQAAYPGKAIGTGIRYSKSKGEHVESIREAGSPPAVLEKCITQLGMNPIPPTQSIIDNVESQISLGLIQFREGEDNYQKDMFPHNDGSGQTTGSLGIVSTWLAKGYPAGLNAPEFQAGAAEAELASTMDNLGAKL